MFARRLVAGTTLIPLLAYLACSIALAQEPQLSGRIDDIDDSAFPEVRAIVTLVDGAGRPITGLTPSDFAAEENGAVARVTAVETVLDLQVGVGVILVIDTSGSMEGNPIAQAKAAARGFVQSLQQADQAAVVSFADTVEVRSGLTPDRAQTLAALDGLEALGNTALYSGVLQAVSQSRAAALPRRAIILVSDGQDFGGASQNSREEALGLAADAGVPVYAIGLGLQIDRPFLQELARVSGGAFIEAPSADGIAAVYDQLSQLLRSQYVITFNSDAAADQADRSLKLTVNTPQGQVELTADYESRRTVVAPSPTVAPQPVAVAQPVQEPESGGRLFPLPLLAVLGLAAAGFTAAYGLLLRRRRALAQELALIGRRAAGELNPGSLATSRAGPAGPSRVVRFVGPDLDQTYQVANEPLTIGSGPECQIRLEDGVAETHARIWLREGSLILHHLAPGYRTVVGGHAAVWTSLDRGDEAEIGHYRLVVEQ